MVCCKESGSVGENRVLSCLAAEASESPFQNAELFSVCVTLSPSKSFVFI